MLKDPDKVFLGGGSGKRSSHWSVNGYGSSLLLNRVKGHHSCSIGYRVKGHYTCSGKGSIQPG